MNYKYCPSCTRETANDALNCIHCGKKMDPVITAKKKMVLQVNVLENSEKNDSKINGTVNFAILSFLLLLVGFSIFKTMNSPNKQKQTTEKNEEKVDTSEPVRNDEAKSTEELTEIPDIEPVFSQGSVNVWLSKNITYPEISRENGDEGAPVISFIVEKDGSISKVKVLKSSRHNELDNEAKKAVSKMPSYIPAQNYGKPVRSRFQVKVSFKLE